MSYLHDSEAMMHVGSFEAAFFPYSFLNSCSTVVSEAEMIDDGDDCEIDNVSVCCDRVCLVNRGPKDR